jgi:hypothetical protein
MLLVGGGGVTEVRPDVLDSLPRGLPVGIEEAPDALPAADRLSAAAWSVCAVPSGAPGVPATVSVLVGIDERGAGRIPDDAAVLATDPGGNRWLLADGRRHLLPPGAPEPPEIRAARPVPLPSAVLDTVPEGPRIVRPEIAGRGGPALGTPQGTTVGTLLRTPDARCSRPWSTASRPSRRSRRRCCASTARGLRTSRRPSSRPRRRRRPWSRTPAGPPP